MSSRPESPPGPETIAAFQKPFKDLDETTAASAAATDSHQETSTADESKQLLEKEEDDEQNDDNDNSTDEEFEFAFVSGDPDIIAADEIFLNGQIRPVYPVFGQDRDLLFLCRPEASSGADRGKAEVERAIRMPLRKITIEDERAQLPSTSSCSSSESDELGGLPADSYCLWTPGSVPPSPEMRRKSKSTGSSSSRGWKLRDFVIGRSHSDGKHKFLFLSASAPPPPPLPSAPEPAGKKSPGRNQEADEGEKVKGKGKGKGKGGGSRKGKPGAKASELDMVTAHRLYYASGEAAAGGELRRRSYLPYRKDLVGFFSSVNGTSRGFRPF